MLLFSQYFGWKRHYLWNQPFVIASWKCSLWVPESISESFANTAIGIWESTAPPSDLQPRVAAAHTLCLTEEPTMNRQMPLCCLSRHRRGRTVSCYHLSSPSIVTFSFSLEWLPMRAVCFSASAIQRHMHLQYPWDQGTIKSQQSAG